MKKVIFILFAALISFTSCEKCSTEQYAKSIEYNLIAKGNADGEFIVSFPQGKFTSNGDVELNFEITSQNQLVLAGTPVKSLTKSLQSNDIETLKAAEKVADELEKFSISSAGGHYNIHVKGYMKEPVTGFIFEIDRIFTNL